MFANLRPAICFKQLVEASSLKPEIVSGLDIMIVRELTGGIYLESPGGLNQLKMEKEKGLILTPIRVAKLSELPR